MDRFALKRNVKRVLWTTGASLNRRVRAWGRGSPEIGGSLRVLMYHKVNDTPARALTVSARAFREQQVFLAEHYRVVSLDEVVRALDGGPPLPPRAVLLTFDDGYQDNFSIAYPILKELGHRAVVFVPTDFVDNARPLPHDEQLSRPDPTLTWKDLRAMRDVFEIGSHACSHRSLPSLPLDEALSEIGRSKRVLEAALDGEVRAFAYVKGDWNPALEDGVRASGYRVAFLTLPGTNRPPLNPYRFLRYNAEDFGLAYFSDVLAGSADFLALKDSPFGAQLKGLVNELLVGSR